MREFIIPIDITGNFDTGIAFFNPEVGRVTLTMRLRDRSGVTVSAASMLLDGKNHKAQFVSQLFTGVTDFRGSLWVSATGEVAALTLRQNLVPLSFTTLPVAPGPSALTVSPSEIFITPQIPNPMHVLFKGQELEFSQLNFSFEGGINGRVDTASRTIQVNNPWQPGNLRVVFGDFSASVPVRIAELNESFLRTPMETLIRTLDSAHQAYNQAAQKAQDILQRNEFQERTRSCRELLFLGTWIWRVDEFGNVLLSDHQPITPTDCNIDTNHSLKLASFRVTRLPPFTHDRLRDVVTGEKIQYDQIKVDVRFEFTPPPSPEEWLDTTCKVLWDLSLTINWHQIIGGISRASIGISTDSCNTVFAKWFVDELLSRQELCPGQPPGSPCHPGNLTPLPNGFSISAVMVGVPRQAQNFFDIAVAGSRPVDRAKAKELMAQQSAKLLEAYKQALLKKLEAWEELKRLQGNSPQLKLREVLDNMKKALDLKVDIDGSEVDTDTAGEFIDQIEEPFKKALERNPRLGETFKNLKFAIDTFNELKEVAEKAIDGAQILNLLMSAEKNPTDAISFINTAFGLMDTFEEIPAWMGPWIKFYSQALTAVSDAIDFIADQRIKQWVDSGLPCEEVAKGFANPVEQEKVKRLCKLRDLKRRIQDP